MSGQPLNYRRSLLPVLLCAVVIALLLAHAPIRDALSNAWSMMRHAEQDELRAWVRELGAWGPALLILAMCLQMFFAVVPSALLISVAALSYAPVAGVLLAMLAVAVAAVLGYALGHWLSEQLLRRWLSLRMQSQLQAHGRRYGLWLVFIARLNPALSNDLISFAAGAARLPFWSYLAATLAGTAPLAILIVIIGGHSESLSRALLLISGIGLTALITQICWDWHQRHKKRSAAASRGAG